MQVPPRLGATVWWWGRCISVRWNVQYRRPQSVTGNGGAGSVVWWGWWGESRRWPLVIPALQSSPPGEGWWHCQWVAGRPGDARAGGRRQPDWRKAGGSPCAGRAGSADGSRYTQTATRSLLLQRRLQSYRNTYIWRCASIFNFSLCGGRETTLVLIMNTIN